MFLICPFFLLPAYEDTKRCEVTKKVRKGYKEVTKEVTKSRKRYEITKNVRSYKKVRSYETGTKRSRNKLRKALVTKLPKCMTSRYFAIHSTLLTFQ